MRNKHIKNGEVVEKELRFKIYEKALDIIQNNKKYPSGLDNNDGLCLLLPCLLWNPKYFLNNLPDGTILDCNYTKDMFPELKYFLVNGTYGKYTRSQRIEFLTKTLSK